MKIYANIERGVIPLGVMGSAPAAVSLHLIHVVLNLFAALTKVHCVSVDPDFVGVQPIVAG